LDKQTETQPASSPTRLVVLSGPSGSGKSTVVDRLLEAAPVPLVKSVSATTRPPRPAEIDGADYYFLSNEEFEQKRNAGAFLEWAEVHASGFWYGTLRSELDRANQADAWALLEIDVAGALNVMKKHPDAVTIFLTTSSESEYDRRLRARGTESEEVIRRRLETARRELQSADQYRYQVVNDDLDRAARSTDQAAAAKRSLFLEIGGI
jgi:guanylate kinase